MQQGNTGMTHTHVTFERQGPVGIVRLNRPDKLNALDRSAYAGINTLIARINDDPAILVGLICGSGRAFCSGVDVNDLACAIKEAGSAGRASVARQFAIDFEETQFNPKPLICAVNGLCVGNGLTMALACDLRVAASDARFSLPEVKIGIASVHGTIRSVQMAGLGKALELLLTGEMRDATWACEAGLINLVVPPEDLIARALDLAQTIAGLDPSVIKTTRSVAYHAAHCGFDSAVALGVSLRSGTELVHPSMTPSA